MVDERHTPWVGKNEAVFPLGLILFLAAITLYRAIALYAANLPLFLDEAYYFDWSRTLAFGYYSKPPLIAWTIAATTSLCGENEFCVRTPALLVHPFTAFALFLVGRHLYGAQTGQRAAILYATLPMVFASSWIMSTDALLLLFWSYGLWFLVRALEDDRLFDWLGLGVCIGLGSLAKYTMLVFLLSLLVYLAFSPIHRHYLRRPKLYTALIVAIVTLLPNMVWNTLHDLVSVRHTASNAALDHPLFHPAKLFEFLVGQALVCGPLLLGVLPMAMRRQSGTNGGGRSNEVRRLLLTMSVPLFVAMLAEALAVRANANWAAPSYLGFTLLIAAWFTQPQGTTVHTLWRSRLLVMAVLLNGVIGGVGYHYDALSRAFVGTERVRHLDPYARLRGWRELAAIVQNRLVAYPEAGLLGDDRAVLAELGFYLRPRPPSIAVWNPTGVISDQYRLNADIHLQPPTASGYLFVARGTDFDAVSAAFAKAEDLGRIRIPTHRDSALEFRLYWVQGFVGYNTHNR